MAKDFLRKLIHQIGDENTSLADDGLSSAELGGYIDTGSYALNLLLSGSLFGGVHNNKITSFVGLSAVGKTFFTLGIMRYFLSEDPDARVVYYLTEPAVTKQMMIDRGIDPKRVMVSEPVSIEQFKTNVLKTLEFYEKIPVEERPPLIMVLDSLGALSTIKELEDSLAGKHVRDMTKAQGVKGMFRTVGLKLAKVRVPLILTNHVYQVVGSYIPTTSPSGGTGSIYHSDTIIELTKKKDRVDKEVVGNIITAKTLKARFSRENMEVNLRLSYNTGLDRYYGLLDVAETTGIFQKSDSRYVLPDGTKVYGKSIETDPAKYFTDEILRQLDDLARPLFTYGSALPVVASPSIVP